MIGEKPIIQFSKMTINYTVFSRYLRWERIMIRASPKSFMINKIKY